MCGDTSARTASVELLKIDVARQDHNTRCKWQRNPDVRDKIGKYAKQDPCNQRHRVHLFAAIDDITHADGSQKYSNHDIPRIHIIFLTFPASFKFSAEVIVILPRIAFLISIGLSGAEA